MTVTTEITHNAYTGDGAQTTFTYAFPIQASTDLEVYLDGMLQVGGYSVTGVGSASGTVIFTTAPFAGVAVILLRNTPATQPTTFSDFSNYPASAINGALDRVTMVTQQASADVDRALKADLDDTVGTLPSAATRADMGLGFDSSGDPIAISLTSIANAIPITEKAAALGVATLDANARPVQALAALNGKAINIADDTNLQTWADTFPVSGLYDISLTVAQGNLPIGKWYIELIRYSSDTSGTVYHSMRATSLTGTANVVYLNTSIAGTWSGWENAKGLASLNGKAINIADDTNLQTWADAFPDSGLYDINLTVAQGNLAVGKWYIELCRYSSDTSGTVNHFMRATSLTGTANIVFLNTSIAGTMERVEGYPASWRRPKRGRTRQPHT